MIKKILPIIAITLLVISFSSPATAAQTAYNSTKNKVTIEEEVNNKKTKKAKNQAIKKAIQDKNYQEWKKLLENNKNPQNKRLLKVINQDNFERYADAKILADSGDKTELNQLKKELGLNYKIKK